MGHPHLGMDTSKQLTGIFSLFPSQDYVMDYVINSSDDEDKEPATDEEALIMAEKTQQQTSVVSCLPQALYVPGHRPKNGRPRVGALHECE